VNRLALRWLKFNLVGAIGVGVQLGCLALLKSRMNYLVATALAVEIAVLHNFVWHERFTWKDRPGGTRERLMRLLRFHLGNGVVSILGNMGLMWLFVGRLHMKQVLVANGIAIAICSLLNFALGEWFVFRR
jgi:putative flippase GtrA